MPASYRVFRKLDAEITILGVDMFDFIAILMTWSAIWRIAKLMPSIELTRWLIIADIILCVALWRVDKGITKRRGVGWLLHADTYNRLIYPKHAFEQEGIPADIQKAIRDADC